MVNAIHEDNGKLTSEISGSPSEIMSELETVTIHAIRTVAKVVGMDENKLRKELNTQVKEGLKNDRG